MSNKPKVYLGGPVAAQSYKRATNWRRHLAQMLEPDIECLDPMRGKEVLDAKEGPIGLPEWPAVFPELEPVAIVARDYEDLHSSDLVFFNFEDGLLSSIGSLIELGWATALHKPVVILRGVVDPAFMHPFLLVLPTLQIFGSLDTVAEEIRNLLLKSNKVVNPKEVAA